MLSFSGSLKVFVAVEPCDMRRSFNGLHDIVSTRLMEDPKIGSSYAFTNKRRPLPPDLRHIQREARIPPSSNSCILPKSKLGKAISYAL